MFTQILNIYFLIVIVCLTINLKLVMPFIVIEIPEIVVEVSNQNHVSGKILTPIAIILFVLLYPIMLSVILLKGAANKC